MSFPKHQKYKHSGIEWLGEVPAHWRTTKTKHVARFTTGWTPPTGDAASFEGENLWANISDLGPKVIQDTAKRISDLAIKTSRIEASPAGSLLFSFKLSIGQVSFAGVDLYTNEAIATFPESDALSLKFAYYAFPILLVQNAAENIYGAKLLNQELIRSASFTLPPFTEQVQIAAFLDKETPKIDALVEEQRRLIELLKEKRQAVISQAVTKGLDPNVPMKDSGVEWLGNVPAHWKVGKAGFYVGVLPGYAFSAAEFSRDETDVRLLRGVNVAVGDLRWEDVVYWRRTAGDGLQPFELQAGDLVIGMDRPLISNGMRVALVKEADLPCLLLQRVAKILVGPGMYTSYFMRLLGSRMFEAHFAPETTGVSVPHISGEQIMDFVIPVPSFEEQHQIARHLDDELEKLLALEEQAQRAMALFAERRSALISAAVTGKIDVRGLVPQPEAVAA